MSKRQRKAQEFHAGDRVRYLPFSPPPGQVKAGDFDDAPTGVIKSINGIGQAWVFPDHNQAPVYKSAEQIQLVEQEDAHD